MNEKTADLTVTKVSTSERLEDTDSGYASAATTPPRGDTENPQTFPARSGLSAHGIFNRKVTKLRVFDLEIPQSAHDRFSDLNELFSEALYQHLVSANVRYTSISIKLKVLGETKATAKPWVVVLCDPQAVKSIKQFFNQRQVKAQYQQSSDDLFLPSFEVMVYG